MRKITIKAATALATMQKMASGNTRVAIEERTYDGEPLTCAVMYLHDNQIAIYDGELLTIRDAGWQTVTTKERLNGVLDTLGTGLGISQKDWSWSITNRENKLVMNWSGAAQFKIEAN